MRIRRRVVVLAVVVFLGGAWLLCQNLLFRREMDKRIAELKEQVRQKQAVLDEQTKIREELEKQEKEGMAARCGVSNREDRLRHLQAQSLKAAQERATIELHDHRDMMRRALFRINVDKRGTVEAELRERGLR